MTSIQPTNLARAQAGSSGKGHPPAAIEGMANSFHLGALKATQRHGPATTVYQYQRATITAHSGKVSTVEFRDGAQARGVTLLADEARMAQVHKLGAFRGTDAAMGHRVSVNFARGSMVLQNNQLEGMSYGAGRNESFVPANVLRIALRDDLGAYKGLRMGREHGYYTFEKGELQADIDW